MALPVNFVTTMKLINLYLFQVFNLIISYSLQKDPKKGENFDPQFRKMRLDNTPPNPTSKYILDHLKEIYPSYLARKSKDNERFHTKFIIQFGLGRFKHIAYYEVFLHYIQILEGLLPCGALSLRGTNPTWHL